MTQEQQAVINKIKPELKEVGLELNLTSGDEYIICEHSQVRSEIHNKGWETYFSQRAYMMTAFAYKTLPDNKRVVTAEITADVAMFTKDQLWRQVLSEVSGYEENK